jgi:hypothetical protein
VAWAEPFTEEKEKTPKEVFSPYRQEILRGFPGRKSSITVDQKAHTATTTATATSFFPGDYLATKAKQKLCWLTLCNSCLLLLASSAVGFQFLPDPSVALPAPKKARKAVRTRRPALQGKQISSRHSMCLLCSETTLTIMALAPIYVQMTTCLFMSDALPPLLVHSPVKLSGNQWDLSNYLFSEKLSSSCRSVPEDSSERKKDKVRSISMMSHLRHLCCYHCHVTVMLVRSARTLLYLSISGTALSLVLLDINCHYPTVA